MSSHYVKAIRENISRARAALSRGQFVKSFDAGVAAFEGKLSTPLMGKDKFEVEFQLEEYCTDVSNNQVIRDLLAARQVTAHPFLPYRKGKEQTVIKRLKLLRMEWERKQNAEEEAAKSQHESKKAEIVRRGQQLLREKDFPRAKSILRQAAEQYGDEPGFATDIGERLVEACLYFEAAEILLEVIERFPSDSKAYSLLINAYASSGELSKAEDMYLAALRQFGAHPRTQLNLSKLYMQMRKFDEAYDYARLAQQGDSSLTEANEIVEKLEKRLFNRPRSDAYKV